MLSGILGVGIAELVLLYSFDVEFFPQALADLTNGLLRDNRIFHITDPDWIDKYNNQGTIVSVHVSPVSPSQ